MVDIEAKSLNFLRRNITSIDKIKEEDIETLINTTTYIENWNVGIRLKTYISLVEYIITECNIDEIYSSISMLAHKYRTSNNKDAKFFYAVVDDFKNFFERVYNIYMLDQILFILSSSGEINMFDLLMPRKTGSCYEEYKFGLYLIQEAFDSYSFWENIDITLYKTKDYYLKELKKLLQKEKYRERFIKLKDTCRDICVRPQNDSWYAFNMFTFLETLKFPNKQMVRARVPREKNIKNQLTLFDN